MKLSKLFLTLGWNAKLAAHPLAEPNTSEYEIKNKIYKNDNNDYYLFNINTLAAYNFCLFVPRCVKKLKTKK